MCQSNKFCKSIFIITNNICFMVVRSSSICFYRPDIKKVTKSRNYIIGQAFALCGHLHESWPARKGNIKLFPQNSSINLIMCCHNFSSPGTVLGFATEMEINRQGLGQTCKLFTLSSFPKIKQRALFLIFQETLNRNCNK